MGWEEKSAYLVKAEGFFCLILQIILTQEVYEFLAALQHERAETARYILSGGPT